MDFEKMQKNLIDLIKEEQAKLGYRKETIRLYYPLGSLRHLFEGAEDDSVADMVNRLSGIGEYTKDTLGEIEVSNTGERFCFCIPETGSEYVYNNTSDNEFIKSLVDIVGRHESTIDEIKALFESYSDNIHFENINNGEFDYLIYFEDIADDKYYYCFKDEGIHIIYHRFIREDYEEYDF